MGVFKRLGRWFYDRLQLEALVKTLTDHKVPAETIRKGWMYVFGAGLLTAFVIQILTGVALVTKYIPSPDNAYASLRFITEEAWLGDLTRAMHFYGGSAMVLFMALHMARVFLTGSYKFPREMNWILGMVLFVLTMGMAFTGQLLRWDQDGVWSVVVAAKWLGRVPLIGNWLNEVVLAGPTVGGTTLSRFYAVHVFVFPALIIAFVAAHLYLVYQNGISEPPKAGQRVDPHTYREHYAKLKREGDYYFPNQTWHEALVAVLLLAGVVALAILFGPQGPGPEPDPTQLAADPRPDWFLIWYYALIYIKPRGAESLFMVYLPIALFLWAVALPLVFRGGERSPTRRPWAIVVVVLAFMTLGYLIHLGHRGPWVPRFDTQPLTAAAIGEAPPHVHQGAQLHYERGCQYCHRVLGEGGIYGPDLTRVTLRMSPEETTVRIVNGIGDMPAYRDILPQEEIDAILAFLRHVADRAAEGAP